MASYQDIKTEPHELASADSMTDKMAEDLIKYDRGKAVFRKGDTLLWLNTF